VLTEAYVALLEMVDVLSEVVQEPEFVLLRLPHFQQHLPILDNVIRFLFYDFLRLALKVNL
jgi:hypothetical protein